MQGLINKRKIDFACISKINNKHHTGNYYITAPIVFSMEGLTLINEINSIFTICMTPIKQKHNLKLLFGLPFY